MNPSNQHDFAAETLKVNQCRMYTACLNMFLLHVSDFIKIYYKFLKNLRVLQITQAQDLRPLSST